MRASRRRELRWVGESARLTPRKANRNSVNATGRNASGARVADSRPLQGKGRAAWTRPPSPLSLHVVVVARPRRPVRLRARAGAWSWAWGCSGRCRTRGRGRRRTAATERGGRARRWSFPMPGDGGSTGRDGGAWGTAGFTAPGDDVPGWGRSTPRLPASRGRPASSPEPCRAASAPLLASGRFSGSRLAGRGLLRGRLARGRPLRRGSSWPGPSSAPVLRAVLRTARAVLRPVLRTARAAFLAVLRGLAFFVVCAFLPTRFRSHGFCSDLLCYRSRPLKGRRCTTHASLVQACRPTGRVNRFFHYTMIGSESGNLACPCGRQHRQLEPYGPSQLRRARAECPRSPSGGGNPGRRSAPRRGRPSRPPASPGWAAASRHDLEIAQDRCRIGGRSA